MKNLELVMPSPERLEKLLVCATFLTPFVSIGTVKVGVRIVAADWLLLAVGIAVLLSAGRYLPAFREHSRGVAAATVLAFAAVSGLSLLIGITFYSDENRANLLTGSMLVQDIGEPFERGLVDQMRLIQGVAGFLAILALVRTQSVWRRVAGAFIVAGVVVALYGGYQVAAQGVFGAVPQPPGAFPYPELDRASGTFPEPNAYIGFLLFAATCSVVLLQERRSWRLNAALVVIVLGAVLSRSAAGLVALLVLLIALALLDRGHALAVAAAAVACGLVLTIVVAGPETVRDELVGKSFGEANSRLDRKASWEAALKMGATYAPLGVGRGQYAYNVAPFLSPEDSLRAGRAQSVPLEIWAELGPVGAGLGLTLFLIGPFLLVTRRITPPKIRNALWVLSTTFAAALVAYYTSTYVWLWVALGLMITGPLVYASSTPNTPGHTPIEELQKVAS